MKSKSFTTYRVTLYICNKRHSSDLLLKDDDEELEGEVHEVAGVEAVPECEKEERNAL